MSEQNPAEHRHVVGGLLRAHVPARLLRTGQIVFVVPRFSDRPRAAKAGPIPAEGMAMKVNEYIFSMAQRGAVLCYEKDGAPVEQPEKDGAN